MTHQEIDPTDAFIVVPERDEIKIFYNESGTISILSPNPEGCCNHVISLEVQDVEKVIKALRRIKKEVLEGGME